MSNKRNSTLTTVAFYAVLFICLVGVGAGAWLLLFPTVPEVSEDPELSGDSQVVAGTAGALTEIPDLAAVPGEGSELPDAQPTESDPVEAEPPADESDPPAVVVVTPAPVSAEPVVAEPPNPVTTPLEGEVVTAFSLDALTYSATLGDWRTHDGIDIAAEAGTAVLAACAGTVADIRDDELLGTTIVLQHSGGCRTTYASLEPEVAVRFGETVAAGQQIGTVGTSAAGEAAEGAHLHFSVSKNGELLDPEEYLKK